LIKPVSNFCFQFQQTLRINNTFLGLTVRVRLYSEPVSYPSAPLIPLYPKSPVAGKPVAAESHLLLLRAVRRVRVLPHGLLLLLLLLHLVA
jgi:hypothetical protein